MKKLTDGMVARALGWKFGYNSEKGDSAVYRGWWNAEKFLGGIPPAFTTSLDAITAEIERRGLKWMYSQLSGYASIYNGFDSDDHVSASAPTAPLALCKALLAFIGHDNFLRVRGIG